jgi:UDP-N-acetyl-D-mannosaminuronate dehydrogenase
MAGLSIKKNVKEVREMKKKKLIKTLRKSGRKHVEMLLSNMTFLNRWQFVFTGNHYKPLERTYAQLNRKKEIHG